MLLHAAFHGWRPAKEDTLARVRTSTLPKDLDADDALSLHEALERANEEAGVPSVNEGGEVYARTLALLRSGGVVVDVVPAMLYGQLASKGKQWGTLEQGS